MKNEIVNLSAVSLIQKIKSKEVSSHEVMQAFLDRIELVNPKINAIHQVNPGQLLKQADEKDKAIAKGEKLGRLHGLPVSMKDHCYVKGFVCTRSSYLVDQTPATFNATIAQRLIDEGAIILGLTNVPEFLTAYETDSLQCGRTNNPYDLTRTPGGSSGGESALIAAGGSPLGIGSDAGGSIRVPAHLTGIVGHKPTQYTIPSTGSIPSDEVGLIGQVATYGPMARYVEDLILGLSVLQGPDQQDPYCMPLVPHAPFHLNPKKLRIGYFLENGVAETCPAIAPAIQNILKHFEQLGAVVEPVHIPNQNELYAYLWETLICQGAGMSGFKQWAAQSGKPISKELKRFMDLPARVMDTETLKQYLFEIDRFRRGMLKLVQPFDVLISPVAETVAWPHEEAGRHFQNQAFCWIYNITGWPASVVPCAMSKTGFPIGVQIAAKPFCDHVSLAVADYIQKWVGVFSIVTP